jgi:3-hydroxyacyl-[acyl-carrier-protein] dehydratase
VAKPSHFPTPKVLPLYPYVRVPAEEGLWMLDYSQIRSILPHGHPTLLVDRVVSLEPGVSAVGIKAITGSEPCYRDLPSGSGPRHYAYPVSLLIESFGQTAAILWLRSVRSVEESADHVLMFVAARDLRIEGQAYPGAVLHNIVRLDRIVSDTVFVGGEVWLENRRIISVGSMIAALRPRSVVMGHASAIDAANKSPYDTATEARYRSSE